MEEIFFGYQAVQSVGFLYQIRAVKEKERAWKKFMSSSRSWRPFQKSHKIFGVIYHQIKENCFKKKNKKIKKKLSFKVVWNSVQWKRILSIPFRGDDAKVRIDFG